MIEYLVVCGPLFLAAYFWAKYRPLRRLYRAVYARGWLPWVDVLTQEIPEPIIHPETIRILPDAGGVRLGRILDRQFSVHVEQIAICVLAAASLAMVQYLGRHVGWSLLLLVYSTLTWWDARSVRIASGRLQISRSRNGKLEHCFELQEIRRLEVHEGQRAFTLEIHRTDPDTGREIKEELASWTTFRPVYETLSLREFLKPYGIAVVLCSRRHPLFRSRAWDLACDRPPKPSG